MMPEVPMELPLSHSLTDLHLLEDCRLLEDLSWVACLGVVE